jgi:hypothetical protein
MKQLKILKLKEQGVKEIFKRAEASFDHHVEYPTIFPNYWVAPKDVFSGYDQVIVEIEEHTSQTRTDITTTAVFNIETYDDLMVRLVKQTITPKNKGN